MASNKKDKHPPSSDWIKKLENSIGPETDPICRVAKHIHGNGWMYPMRQAADDDQSRGSLHFGVPAEWRETHPFSFPKGMHHTDSGAAPFTDAVENGTAMVMWLTPGALAPYLPKADARQLLENRAEALRSAVESKCDIHPLEVRLYYPPEKFINATSQRGHEMRAALILATDAKHAETLRTTVHQLLMRTRNAEEMRAANNTGVSGKKTSQRSLQALLEPHRDATGQSTLDDPLMPIAEVAAYTQASGLIYAQAEDGLFHIPNPEDNKKQPMIKCSPEDLSINKENSHFLLLKLEKGFLATPNPTHKKNPLNSPADAACEHDKQAIIAFYQALTNKLGGQWHGGVLFDTPMGDVLTVAVDGPNQENLLEKARNLIDRQYHKRRDDHADWKQYLDERQIHHTPPQPRR